MNAKQGKSSIEQFERIHQIYPESERAPISRFLKGFVAETVLGDIDLARKYYGDFVRAYPEHDLTVDARMSMEMLGLSNEELLKRITAGKGSSEV